MKCINYMELYKSIKFETRQPRKENKFTKIQLID